MSNFKIPFIVVTVLLVLCVGAGAYLYYDKTQTEIQYQQQLASVEADLNTSLELQKQQKNQITDLWDKQTSLNDDLIDQQRQVIGSSNEYIDYTKSMVRFVEGVPQLFPGVTEEQYLASQNALIQEIADLERLAEENAIAKTDATNEINRIYLESEEDRNNSANDRDGIR